MMSVEVVKLVFAYQIVSVLVRHLEEVHHLIFCCHFLIFLFARVEIIQHCLHLCPVQVIIVVGIVLVEKFKHQILNLCLRHWTRLFSLDRLILRAGERRRPQVFASFDHWLGFVTSIAWRSGTATHLLKLLLSAIRGFRISTYSRQFAVSPKKNTIYQKNGLFRLTDYKSHTRVNIYFSKMGGAFLSQPVTEKVVKRYQHGKIRVVSCEMQGWRKYMEDAVLFHRISKDIFLFAVFDGHGGMEVSQLCAKKIIELLEANRSFQSGNYARALEETFKELDEFLGSEHGEEILKNTTIENGLQPFENSKVADSVGCTANVVLLVGKTLYVANAGDSRAALSRLGSLIELSYDHKPEDPIELQRIVASGAKVEGGRINNHLNLSRCLGDLYYKKSANLPYERQTITGHPDVKTIELCKDDDFIVIGCDGIWQRYQKNSQDLITLIRQQRLKGKTPQQVLSQMLDGFLAKDPSKQQLGCDNMSVILVELNKNAF